MTIDLHTHSRVSDGTLSPTELIDHAKEVDLEVIALTDHDTLDGIEEAMKRGKEIGVRVIPGVEFSCAEGEEEHHILGLDLDCQSSSLREDLASFCKGRHTRIGRMLEQLKAAGHDIPLSEVEALSGEGAIGRPHIAEALMRRGVVDSIQEAFAKWLTPGKPGFVPKNRFPAGDAIDLIQKHGGVSVLAHPGENMAEVAEKLRALVPLGLDGVEVYYSRYSDEVVEVLRSLAKKFSIGRSGGSDFHGERKPDVKLGCRTVPEEAFEELMERKG